MLAFPFQDCLPPAASVPPVLRYLHPFLHWNARSSADREETRLATRTDAFWITNAFKMAIGKLSPWFHNGELTHADGAVPHYNEDICESWQERNTDKSEGLPAKKATSDDHKPEIWSRLDQVYWMQHEFRQNVIQTRWHRKKTPEEPEIQDITLLIEIDKSHLRQGQHHTRTDGGNTSQENTERSQRVSIQKD